MTATHRKRGDTRLHYLQECVESVQAQESRAPQEYTYRHLIINDGSPDGGETAEYLEALVAEDPRVHAVNLRENVGQAFAIELGKTALMKSHEGLFALNGTYAKINDFFPGYTIVLDSDDMLIDDKPKADTSRAQINTLSTYSHHIRHYREKYKRLPCVLFAAAEIIDTDGNLLSDVPHIPRYNNIPDTSDPVRFFGEMLLCNHLPSKPAISSTVSLLSSLGLRHVRAASCYDWITAMHAFAKEDGEDYVDISRADTMSWPTSIYRVHDDQISIQNQKTGRWDQVRQLINDSPYYNPLLARELHDLAKLLNAPVGTSDLHHKALQCYCEATGQEI
jgi:glycosyltransferase involved in cell wall biosynthesis